MSAYSGRQPEQAELLRELHGAQRRMSLPSLAEAVRLLTSERFRELTDEHVRAVGQYQAIKLGQDWFFDKAFTTGKEAAATLGFAQLVGRDVVLADLQRLLGSATGRGTS